VVLGVLELILIFDGLPRRIFVVSPCTRIELLHDISGEKEKKDILISIT